MSGRDYETGPPSGQDHSGGDMREFNNREFRFRLGAITEADLVEVYGISPNTMDVWERQGLRNFRPATRTKLYLVEDVHEFLKKRETFAGKKRKQRKGPKNGKEKGQTGGETGPPRKP